MKRTTLFILALSLLVSCKETPANSPLTTASSSPSPTTVSASPSASASTTPSTTASNSPSPATASTAPTTTLPSTVATAVPTAVATPAITIPDISGLLPGGLTIPGVSSGSCNVAVLQCAVDNTSDAKAKSELKAQYDPFIQDPSKAGCAQAVAGAQVTYPQCK